MEDEKTILIILDDLWAELELEKVGIPSPDDHKGCKLVLTSRNKQNTTGDSIENPELQPIAVDVAKECAGLPIAIVTVAKALKNKNVSIWKDALQQLKSQTSTNITVQIPNTFFEGMKQLKVLDLTRMQLPLLPLSLQCLANLRTLCLDGCKLGDMVIIAELKKLEILSLMDSDMEQLPREIAQLTHLRLLDLSILPR
ncbi:Disease resistance protein [Vitis vinifera]|uniref:Disease resistance protein n=1 Tax=Vitis vinifera TaxID=29760 RepID=A0A438HUM2_VITVI|nr:Disease resistance protein [Vitis vinifera]